VDEAIPPPAPSSANAGTAKETKSGGTDTNGQEGEKGTYCHQYVPHIFTSLSIIRNGRRRVLTKQLPPQSRPDRRIPLLQHPPNRQAIQNMREGVLPPRLDESVWLYRRPGAGREWGVAVSVLRRHLHGEWMYVYVARWDVLQARSESGADV
jgi:hypothetical protein